MGIMKVRRGYSIFSLLIFFSCIRLQYHFILNCPSPNSPWGKIQGDDHLLTINFLSKHTKRKGGMRQKLRIDPSLTGGHCRTTAFHSKRKKASKGGRKREFPSGPFTCVCALLRNPHPSSVHGIYPTVRLLFFTEAAATFGFLAMGGYDRGWVN